MRGLGYLLSTGWHSSPHAYQEPLHVVPHVFLLVRAAQQVGGVVGTQDGDALVAVKVAAQPADRQTAVEQVLRRAGAEGAQETRPHQFNLPFEIFAAMTGLVWVGQAIAGWTALNDVADVHV